MTGQTYRGVPVPPSLVPNAWELRHFQMGVDSALDVTRPLIDSLYEDTPCSLDHHGYCQEHGLSGPPCADAEAARFLQVSQGTDVVCVSGDGFGWCVDHRPQTIFTTVTRLHGMDPVDRPQVCEQCGRRFV